MKGKTPIRAVMLDFDGVIADTARLKTTAYLALYPTEPDTVREQIRAYCDYQGGVPRRDKIRHIEQHILHHSLSEQRLGALCDQFTHEVFEQVVAAPYIPGAREFIERYHRSCLLFVISGTPQEEMSEVCRQRGISCYFAFVAGSPTSKTAWVSRFLHEYRLTPQETVFVGDSINDFDAARQTGVRFIGVGNRSAGLLPPEVELISTLLELPACLGESQAGL